MDIQKTYTEKLVQEGQQLLQEGKFKAAEKAFAAALKLDECAPIRNNMALAVFMAGEPRRALQTLEPYINPAGGVIPADPGTLDFGALDFGVSPEPNPFTHALAARIYCALDQPGQAREQLKQAVRSFEDGLAALRRAGLGQSRNSYLEYTVGIMQAAADLNDHRLVFDLYRRWESYHISWQNKYLAAVACFNTGRYKRAASLWSSIAGVHHLFSAMQQVAFMVERGIIPPFEMGYQQLSDSQLEKTFNEAARNEEALRRLVQEGYFRMMLLAWMVGDEQNDHLAARILNPLIYYGGEWGEKLGRRILEHPGFTPGQKMVAAEALMKRGILPEDEPVPMFIEGEMRLVEIKKGPVITGPDPELDKIVDRAIKLRDSGREDQAEALLNDLYMKGTFYPRAMMTLANLWRRGDKLQEALQVMEMLEQMAPEDPAILFNLAGLMLQLEEPRRARQYLNRIDTRKAGGEIRQKIEGLKKDIELAEIISSMFQEPGYLTRLYAEEQRNKIEEKPLPVDPTMARGLKNMPVHWLEGALEAYGIKPARLRRDKEKQLVEFLSRPENLTRALEGLQAESLELLDYLLRREGWSRLNAITRKFGNMEGDGFFWNEPEDEPQSPLGVLWSRGLVVVGRANINNRKCKIAAIPVELRQPLAELISKSENVAAGIAFDPIGE